VAARAQRKGQREEREQVAGRADRDDDEALGFDAELLLEYGTVSRRFYPCACNARRSHRYGPDRILRPAGDLSGGERMRGALLPAVLREPTPKLLMLDEPTNHLDLASVEALEAMLASWPGALVVVSHDARFLEKLALTHRLDWTLGRWSVREI